MFKFIITRPPAVTDVLGSWRNVGALRPARRVGFRGQAPGGCRRLFRTSIDFVTPTALNPFQAKDASRQPWPGARDASRQYF